MDPVLEIDSKVRKLLQLPEEISLNDLGADFEAHVIYCDLLGITGGLYDRLMRDDLRARGLVRILSRESLQTRILSTASIPKPTIPLVDLAADVDGTGTEADRS